MKQHLVSSLVLGCILGLTGCGGSDNKDSNTQQNGGNTNNGSGTETDVQKQQRIETYQEIAMMVSDELLLSGIVDVLVYGKDQISDGVTCTSGTVSKTDNIWTLKDCAGIYRQKSWDGKEVHAAIANGSIEQTTDGFKHQDLKLDFDNGESYQVDAIINEEETDNGGILRVPTLSLKVSNTAAKTATYNITDYQFEFRQLTTTSASTSISGAIEGKDTEQGNFKVKFATNTPFEFSTDSNGERSSVPYAGKITMIDANNTAYQIILSALSSTSANIKILHNTETYGEISKHWDEL